MNVIGENTLITLGMFLSAIVTLGGAIWWASAVNTKLGVLVDLASQILAITHEVHTLDTRVTVLEKEKENV